MFKYKMSLKQLEVYGGIDVLDEKRKEIFWYSLNLTASLLKNTEEIDNVIVGEDYSLLIEANKDVEEMLSKMHQYVCIKKV